MDALWRVELLGGLQAVNAGRVVTRFRTRKTGALLAYLAFYSRRCHPREAVIEQLWPECDPGSGRHSLRTALSSLRRQLEPPGVPAGCVILADASAVQLNPATCLTDVSEFEAALSAAARAGSGTERVHRLTKAVEMYRGELLSGWLQEWVVPEQQRLAELYFQALRELIAGLEHQGEFARAIAYARRGVAADALREEIHHDLIRLLAAAGQPEAARRQAQALERVLAAAGGAPARPGGSQRPVMLAPSLEAPLASAPPLLPSISPPHAPLAHLLVPPAGTVTFLLGEIPGGPAESDRSWETAQPVLPSCRALIQCCLERHGGSPVRDSTDAFIGAFQNTRDALLAAVALREEIGGEPSAVNRGAGLRLALHTAIVEFQEGQYAGAALTQAERLLLAAHPGQIILSEEAATLLRREPPAGLQFVDLGLYRLDEQASPERLFQVHDPGAAAREFPPPSALPAIVSQPLPQLTRFFGREEELARLGEMLGGITTETRRARRETTGETAEPPRFSFIQGGTQCHRELRGEGLLGPCRLLTLTGPGGIGKTRLALELAGRLRQPWREAVWFVPLQDLSEPQRVIDQLLEVLHLPRSPHVAPCDQVVAYLSRQPSLLLLDNFEQLLPEGAATVRWLLEQVPTLTVLVTSRQRLNLNGVRDGTACHPG